jgi:hypothetical protein
MCLAIGKLAKPHFQSMPLGSSHNEWVNSIKYLSVTLCSGRSPSFIIVIHNFYTTCNCVCAQAKHLYEIIHVSMQESYCLPILIYASAAVRYSAKHVDEVHACLSSVIRRIFGFHKYESVKGFICRLGR